MPRQITNAQDAIYAAAITMARLLPTPKTTAPIAELTSDALVVRQASHAYLGCSKKWWVHKDSNLGPAD